MAWVLGEGTKKATQPRLGARLYAAWSYMYNDAGRRLDFYLLWLARFLLLTIGAGVLTHWKTFSFTQSNDDKEWCIFFSQFCTLCE